MSSRFHSWGGISSLQFLLSAFWTGAQSRGFSLVEVARFLCLHPAIRVGLHPRQEFAGGGKKGQIAPTYDADLVVWDPEAEFTVDETMIRHRHHVTPYRGCRLLGKVHRTYVAGELAYDGGNTPVPYGQLV